MKNIRLLVLKSLLSLTGVACLLIAATPHALASAEDQIDAAVTASKAWVSQIDAGQYDDSYSFACDEMHDKVKQDQWVLVLKGLRTPWGPVVSRKQISHIYKPNGVPGLEGECVVVTYDTSFRNLDSAKEEVVLKWEGGKWRGAGYTAGPQAQANDGSAPPPVDPTEVHTETNVKPQPQ